MSGVASTTARAVAKPVASPVVGDAASGGGAWSPLNLLGLEWWLDASDLATITAVGGQVESWADKSGNGRSVVNTSGNNSRPDTGVVTVNGLNALRLTSNSVETLLTAGETPVFSQPYQLFLVCVPTASVDGSRSLGGRGASYPMLWGSTNWTLFAGAVGSSSIASNQTSGNLFVSGLFNGASSKIWVNSNAPQTVDPGAASLSGLCINGSPAGAGFHMDASFCEIIVCSADNTANMDDLKAYINTKWGFSLT